LECGRMKIPILPPDINESFAKFTLIKGASAKDDKIRFGLETVKNVGGNIVQAIIETRERGGKFSSITDFIERVQHRDLNKKSLESLIKCGALDELGERAELLENLDSILSYSHEHQRQNSKGQNSLFSGTAVSVSPSIRMKPAKPAARKDRLAWERELLGLYISGHPLEEYQEKLQNKVILLKNLAERPKGSLVVIGGLVHSIKKIITKSGSPMIFATIEDLTGKTEILVFPKVLERTGSVWQEDKIIKVKGRISDSPRDDGIKILCEEAVEVT